MWHWHALLFHFWIKQSYKTMKSSHSYAKPIFLFHLTHFTCSSSMVPSFSLTLKPSESAPSPLFYFITASLPHGTAPDSHYHLNCSSLSFSLCVFFKKFESSCGDFPFSATGWWARFFHSPGSFFLLYLHVGFRHLVQVWIFVDDHAVGTVWDSYPVHKWEPHFVFSFFCWLSFCLFFAAVLVL